MFLQEKIHQQTSTDDVSTVSNFSTLTVSTHGTFGSSNMSTETGEANNAEVEANDQSPLTVNDVDEEEYQYESLNGTCEVDLDAILEQNDAAEPISGSVKNLE